jgi:hypothetical protein
MKTLTREEKIYLALWRKAGKLDGTSIKLSTPNEAKAMRLGMYRVMKPFREGDMLDPELKLIADKFALIVEKGTSNLLIREKTTLSAAERAMAMLGLTEDDLMTDQEREENKAADEALANIMGNIEEVENPFYKQEER